MTRCLRVWSDAKGCLTPQSAEQFNLKYWYRPQAQLLTLLFPSDAISPQQNGVSTSRWDDGINALFINYRLDADNSRAQYDWERSGTDATLSRTTALMWAPGVCVIKTPSGVKRGTTRFVHQCDVALAQHHAAVRA